MTTNTRSVADLVTQHKHPLYDLTEENWIPVLRSGELVHVGFAELLHSAHMIDDIAVADPIEYFALTRYLISIIYLVNFYAGDDGLAGVFDGEAFPAEAVNLAVERLRDGWWLFHPDKPFLQEPGLPFVMSKKVTEKDTLKTVTSSYETLVPFRPAKTNEAWWYRATGDGLSFPEAALTLLSRHFAAVPGNEAGVLGKDKTRCEGGLMLSGPSEVTSLFWRGRSLARTLAANLIRSISDTIDESTLLFTEKPLGVVENLESPLYRFCATGGAAFLVWPDDSRTVERVLRAPLPVSESVAKILMVNSKLSDPHVLRISQVSGSADANNPNKGLVAFSAAASQFENVFSLYRKSAIGAAGLRDSILTARAQTYRLRLADYTLCGTTIEGGGTFTGARINSVTSVTLNPIPLLLDPERSASLALLLSKLAGAKDSCVSQLTYSLTTAVGANSSSTLGGALRSKARGTLWITLERSIEELYQIIATVEIDSLPDTLPEKIKTEWMAAALATFDELVTPYLRMSNVQARAYEARSQLRRALWKKL